MAYFLKKTKNNKGTYLQIYESYHDPVTQSSKHKSFKALGYVHELQKKGIDDPISYYKDEVHRLNLERKMQATNKNIQEISEHSSIKNLGHFIVYALQETLNIEEHLDNIQLQYNIQYSLYEVLSALVYSRIIYPASKLKTYTDVFPSLYKIPDVSLDQIYTALDILGTEYEKIIEVYNMQLQDYYPIETKYTYFDCTNFYFEIDREDDLRRKGPSKEGRKDPIIGMGLLLDQNLIPLGMQMYPGNESEKPVLRKVIQELKERQDIEGKTIRVADKGLNCGDNIYDSVASGDGYIFSKSVKMLPQVEKEWLLLQDGYKFVSKNEQELTYKIKECVDVFTYQVTDEHGKKRTISLEEKRVATYNPSLASKQRQEIIRMVEKAKNLCVYQAKKIEFGESARYVNFEASKDDKTKVKVRINEGKIQEDLLLAGYNLFVTSELYLNPEEIYDAYHNLWRIEESFRILKSNLDTRPVYLSRPERIYGHFLICYLTILLLRILQFKVFDSKYNANEILHFIKNLVVAPSTKNRYINLAKKTKFITELKETTNLPLTHYNLTESNIDDIFRYRFSF